jgi:hypothetical protein
MSQHDMNIANADGATFRADLNSALQAIAENNSGATEPSTTFSYQWWADTTTGILKIRNAANSAWIVVMLLSTGGMIVGADIASGAALPVLDDGHFNDVTGTTGITSIDALGIGSIKYLQFDGILTVTHHATNLVLPSGNNITTVAGQILVFYEYAAGDWRLISNSIPASTSGGGVENLLINGSMRVADRGTSFTAASAIVNNDDTYLMNNWILLSDGNDIVDVTQQTAGGVNGEDDYIRLDIETSAKKFGIFQPIENKDILNVIDATQKVSLSFECQVSNATRLSDIRAVVVAWDSTSDTITSDIISAWGAEGSNPTLVANWTAENVAADLSVTTSWVKYTIEDIAIDTASTTNIGVFIYQNNVATASATGDFLEITNVLLQEGSTASDYPYISMQAEKTRAERCLEVLNKDATTNGMYIIGQSIATNSTEMFIQYKTEKRVAPSVSMSAAADFDVLGATGTPIAVSSLTFSLISNLSCRATAGTAGSLVAGNATILRDTSTGVSRIWISAEL